MSCVYMCVVCACYCACGCEDGCTCVYLWCIWVGGWVHVCEDECRQLECAQLSLLANEMDVNSQKC
jgi:hypothetical protein